jgi:aspartate 1-decarboxylase
MLRTFMHSKIHRATVTDANLSYVGSLTISPELLEAADIADHELVTVVNLNNGARFDTYTMVGRPGAGDMCMNGGAARLAQVGDTVVVISYAQYDEEEMLKREPRVVLVDKNNQITEIETTQAGN